MSIHMTADSRVVASELRAERGTRIGEGMIRLFVLVCGVFVVVSTVLVIAFLARTGIKGIGEVGLGQLVAHAVWKPEANLYGGLPLILGTVISATGAVILGAAPAVLTALWIIEFAPRSLRTGFRRLMEVASAVPSVVYGWLALAYLVPRMEEVARGMYGPDARVGGEGLASASVLLGVMIVPTVLILSLDSLARVHSSLRDASAALGASPLQTAFRVVLPGAWRGLLVAVFFGLARAAGETMAVQMVIGGARMLASNAFSPTTTISTQIVMDMQNAMPGTPASDALYAMSLVLLVLSSGVVLVTRAISGQRVA
ncbi:MAG: phosphate ABC transporter permease subunit PstC [Polyangiaceae bacterium]